MTKHYISSKNNSTGPTNMNGEHESNSELEESKPHFTSSTTEDDSKAQTGYQLGPLESSPRLLDLQGNIFCVFIGDTITLQGIELTIQEASPEKCRLCRVTLED